jgi:hypothetical protein
MAITAQHFDVVIFLCRVKFDQRTPILAGLAAKLTKSRRRMSASDVSCATKQKGPGGSRALFFAPKT